ncbi:MAG TPA: 5'-nucleotidase [Phnomibacter sp.]|nr:5'-nucleotidase [Phnomibacter sp.]
MQRVLYIFLLAATMLTACKPRHYQTAGMQYGKYDIQPGGRSDTTVANMLKPYRIQIDSTMYAVVGKLEQTLVKAQPENSLGFFMTDAMLTEGRTAFKTKVDMAILNYGGIRLNSLQAGNISMGNMYELMPFDNLLVLVVLDGKLLQQLLDHVSNMGSWPVSGAGYSVQNKKAINITVGGEPLDSDKKYTVAMGDYVANGGDNCSFLIGVPQTNIGLTLRDAIINYVRSASSVGRPIGKPMMNRVSFIP